MHSSLELMETLHSLHLSLVKHLVESFVLLLSRVKLTTNSHTSTLLVVHHIFTIADFFDFMISLA